MLPKLPSHRTTNTNTISSIIRRSFDKKRDITSRVGYMSVYDCTFLKENNCDGSFHSPEDSQHDTSPRNKKLKNPLIVKLLSRLDSVSSNKEIIMCWIPGHIEESRNERADSVDKSALDLSPDNISIPYTDLKPQINKFFLTKWQQRWNNNINNKLFQIKPTLGEWRPAFRKSRKEQVIISRLRIGHTSLTHSFILKQGQPRQCLTCQTPYSIKHVLVECGNLAITRERHLKQIIWEIRLGTSTWMMFSLSWEIQGYT